jgi:hypothetical protein
MGLKLRTLGFFAVIACSSLLFFRAAPNSNEVVQKPIDGSRSIEKDRPPLLRPTAETGPQVELPDPKVPPLEYARELGKLLPQLTGDQLKAAIDTVVPGLKHPQIRLFWFEFIQGFVNNWSLEDLHELPRDVVNVLDNQVDFYQRKVMPKLTTTMLSKISIIDRAALTEKVNQLPRETAEQIESATRIEESLVAQRISNQPEEGLKMLGALTPELRTRVLPTLARNLAITNPQKAVSLFLSPDYTAPITTLGEVNDILGNYVNSSLEQASILIRDAPPSSARDWAAAYLTMRISSSDPEAAKVWVAAIADPKLRLEYENKLKHRLANPMPDSPLEQLDGPRESR